MKVLVIAVHMDDAECLTGTMAQLIDKGAEVTYLNIKHYQHYKGNNPMADAQSMTTVTPSHFKFRKFERVADALMRVESKTVDLPEGEFAIEISDYGRICLYTKADVQDAKKQT